MAELGEFGRIAKFFAPLTAGYAGAADLLDDVALLPSDGAAHQSIITVDSLVEEVHFLPHTAPEDLARKALRVNLSDLAAKGASPIGYCLSLALPARCDDQWLAKFAQGLQQDQQQYGLSLMGGDSVSINGPIVVTITMIGRLPAGATLARRGQAQPGDRVYVTGTIGDAALGLQACNGAFFPQPTDQLQQRYLLPDPPVLLGQQLYPYFHASMDISDGLIADSRKIALASNCCLRLESRDLPLSDQAAHLLAEDPDLLRLIVTGGDDYQILFTAAAHQHAAIMAAAAAIGARVTAIGAVSEKMPEKPDFAENDPVMLCDGDGQSLFFGYGGWQHHA